MGDVSKIEWLRGGHTSSPWHGCEHKHLGCINCYAETMAKRNPGVLGVWGPQGTRVRSKSFHANCARWQRYAVASGVRSCVFPSICDPFEDWKGAVLDSKGQVLHRGDAWGAPGSYVTPGVFLGKSAVRLDDLRSDMFATVDRCPDLDFLLLTKRPENIRKMWRSKWDSRIHGIKTTYREVVYRSNVNLIYSASDQATLDAGIMPDLLACRDLCPVLGLSLEPLVGPVPNLYRWLNNHELRDGMPVCSECGKLTHHSYAHYPISCWHCDGPIKKGPRVDWVIVGGESGPNARPCNVEWIRSIVAQCRAAEVPCFVKQLGSAPCEEHDGDDFEYCDTTGIRAIELVDKKGGDANEWPADLRVREFPAPAKVAA